MSQLNSITGNSNFKVQCKTNSKKTADNLKNKESDKERTNNESTAAILTLQSFNNQDDLNNNYQNMFSNLNSTDKDDKDTSSKEIMKKTLDSLIKRIRMLNRMHYNVKSWNRLIKSMGKVESIMIRDDVTVADIRKAISILSGGLAGLIPVEKKIEKEKEEGVREGLPLVLKLKSGAEGVSATPILSVGTSVNTQIANISSSINISV